MQKKLLTSLGKKGQRGGGLKKILIISCSIGNYKRIKSFDKGHKWLIFSPVDLSLSPSSEICVMNFYFDFFQASKAVLMIDQKWLASDCVFGNLFFCIPPLSLCRWYSRSSTAKREATMWERIWGGSIHCDRFPYIFSQWPAVCLLVAIFLYPKLFFQYSPQWN